MSEVFFDDDFDDFNAHGPVPGVCASCGCTEASACEGGCIWANPNATLCSRCATDADAE